MVARSTALATTFGNASAHPEHRGRAGAGGGDQPATAARSSFA